MAEWITRNDIISGIAILMRAGKTLPNASRIAQIKLELPVGTSDKVIAEKCREEQLRQVSELADDWLDVFVPKPEYRTSEDKVLSKERWELAIKETLKLKDYKKVLDMSLVAEGLEKADVILDNVHAEQIRKKQEELNRAWRASSEMTDEQRYRSFLASKWTMARMKKNAYPIDIIRIDDAIPDLERRANYGILMRYAKSLFPNMSDDILTRNRLLFQMQYANETYCSKHCKNTNKCYMDYHRLKLAFDGEKFYFTADIDVCPKISRKEVK